MKILVTGNHTCGNRGDAAILRGLLAHIESLLPGVQIDITSRYPVSSSFLLGRPVIKDPMHALRLSDRFHLPNRVMSFQRNRMIPRLLAKSVRDRSSLGIFIPEQIKEIVDKLKSYDRVIQVGGSFFVDLYGIRQFEMAFASMIANTPVSIVGHSMGPFGSPSYQQLVSTLISHADGVYLRERVTLEMMEKIGLDTSKVSTGADTAWLVDPYLMSGVKPAFGSKDTNPKYVAITLRELAPFDKRLGISQSQYEASFAALADAIIDRGYHIVACSTCTGIESYHRDDRIPALRVKNLVRRPDQFHVIMDELNDVELGRVFANCDLLVGTRLHSAIISMNFGTPAVAINYEHKSAGIFSQLGLPDLASSIEDLTDGSLSVKVLKLLEDVSRLRSAIVPHVNAERLRAKIMIEKALGLYAN